MSGETYSAILDSEIDPESPVTESLMHRLRDNPIAMIQGASGAPRATSKIITPGGSDKDGDFNDGTTLTLPGFFDFSSISLTINKSIPWISRIRVNGDVLLSPGVVLRCLRPDPDSAEADELSMLALYNAIAGGRSTSAATDTGGGGGVIGAGGHSRQSSAGHEGGALAIRPNAFSNSYHSFMLRRHLVGGGSGNVPGQCAGAGGGGCSILMVNGDMELTGATIDCSGQDGPGAGSGASGGGGGGANIVICNGNIHDGTFLAKGGNAANSGSQLGGGGGGGLIILVAASFTGTQVRTVTGGTLSGGGAGSAAAGDNGLAMGNVTLSEEVINSIMLGAVC